VDVIYTDFHKAFDSVNHDIQIQILIASGFGELLLSWFKSFLVDRYQWDSLLNFKSTLYLSSSGVPQGGHLSPILFNIFINIIGNALHNCRFLCFADDVKLYAN
jgi:retron-type reverse transcriptase